MDRAFHKDVEDLTARVVRMAELSRKSVQDGVDAFAALDAAAAQRVVALNQEINRADVDIEARSLDLIALHQPMARDLRALGPALQIIPYLDRIGRYGYDVAKATLALEGKAHVRKLVGIPIMRDRALGILDMAVTAYRSHDAALARQVQPADDDVDGLYDQIFRDCVTHMIEDPRNIPQCTQYI